MSAGRILTLGLGNPFAGAKYLVTLGYGTAATPATTADTHDGYREDVVPPFDEPREAKRKKDALRRVIVQAIEGPQEEASAQALAAIAPHLEPGKPFVPQAPAIDWQAMLADVEAIERIQAAARAQAEWHARLIAEDEQILQWL